jgi:putative mRNA 3-end processing factor
MVWEVENDGRGFGDVVVARDETFLANGNSADSLAFAVVRRKRAVPETPDLFAPRPAVEPPDPPDPDEAPVDPEIEPPRVERKSDSIYFDEPYREFEHSGGIHLTGSILWCDSDRRHDQTFISHAHVDEVGKNRRILATDKTVKILTRGTGKIDALMSPYKRSFTLGPLELEMHPAGHVLGSAQLLIVRDGRRIVYTSDVNVRQTATAERASPVECDVLAIPATYGAPQFRFPPREEVLERIKQFVDDCLNDRATPVLIANPIGTAQELMHFFGKNEYRMRVHRSIYDVAKIYRELGVTINNARRFQGTPARDEVVLFPPILRKHASIRKLKKYKTAIVTGRTMDEAWVYRHRVDAAFPLSDAADHDELVEFIKDTGASEIYLTGGYVEELSAELRAEGFKVYSLVPPEQLSLF